MDMRRSSRIRTQKQSYGKEILLISIREEKMSFEINIISINQEIPVHINFNSQIILRNELENNEESRYTQIWPFFFYFQGILYSLVQEINDGFYSSFPLCESNFEIPLSENLFPNWISNKIKDDLTPFIVKENVYEDFIKNQK